MIDNSHFEVGLDENIWEFEWKRLEKHSRKILAPVILLGRIPTNSFPLSHKYGNYLFFDYLLFLFLFSSILVPVTDNCQIVGTILLDNFDMIMDGCDYSWNDPLVDT